MHAELTSSALLSDLDSLAWAIDADGLAAHEGEAIRIAELAADASVSPVLAEIVADGDAPIPVRERAFGSLVVAINRLSGAEHLEWALAR